MLQRSPIRRVRVRRLIQTAFAALILTGCGGGGSAPPAGSGNNTGSNTGAGNTPAAGTPDLGVGASLNGRQVFPADNPWNQRVDSLPLNPNSDAIINHIGRSSPLHPDFGSDPTYGIPYIVVSGSTPTITVPFLEYPDESDPGPYPVPDNTPIESGSDAHALILDRDHGKLYELYHAVHVGGGWTAGCGAIFDLNSNAYRPAGWTSADAAGLPIFAGLVRYDEVVGQNAITHALRVTVHSVPQGYIAPARHLVGHSADPTQPAMGMRFRLKASVDITGFPPQSRVILQALKTYGMLIADQGSNWYVTGARDSRWDDNDLNAMKRLTGDAFEVVQTGAATTN